MRLLEVLEVFGMVWKVLEGFAGFGGFCEAMRSFERRGLYAFLLGFLILR